LRFFELGTGRNQSHSSRLQALSSQLKLQSEPETVTNVYGLLRMLSLWLLRKHPHGSPMARAAPNSSRNCWCSHDSSSNRQQQRSGSSSGRWKERFIADSVGYVVHFIISNSNRSRAVAETGTEQELQQQHQMLYLHQLALQPLQLSC
jgi:hypothetical protein